MNHIWTIYLRNHNYAKSQGDPVVGFVSAPNQFEAIQKANRGVWHDKDDRGAPLFHREDWRQLKTSAGGFLAFSFYGDIDAWMPELGKKSGRKVPRQ